jgi:hypothetical protein
VQCNIGKTSTRHCTGLLRLSDKQVRCRGCVTQRQSSCARPDSTAPPFLSSPEVDYEAPYGGLTTHFTPAHIGCLTLLLGQHYAGALCAMLPPVLRALLGYLPVLR